MKRGKRLGALARRRLSLAVGSIVLAFGAIVLARAHSAAAPQTPERTPIAHGGTRAQIETPELEGFVALTQGAVLAEGTRELFAELRVTARDGAGEARRQPVALAIALDVSGSMAGDKIVEARRAVRALAERMHDEDRLAIVVYNHEAQLLSPLRSVAATREDLGRVDFIEASGGTNIPAGLSLAAQALSDAPSSMVHRLVVVTDGLDGSGVALTSVQSEVSARANGGTTTSTLGVGVDYDERWLTSVADSGHGNYDLVAQGRELSAFLTRELEEASTTVADRTEVQLDLPAGWRLADVWGAERRDDGRVPLGALFAGERRRVTLRFEVPAGAAGTASELPLALRYRAVANSTDRNLDLGRLSVRVVSDEAMVSASRDVALHAEAVAQRVDARQAQAVEAWRAGRTAEAQQITQQNLAEIQQWQAAAPAAAPALGERASALRTDMDNFGQVSAQSEAGRAYGLGSNARRRARQAAF